MGETIKPNKMPILNHRLFNIPKYDGLKKEINIIKIEQTIKIIKKLLWNTYAYAQIISKITDIVYPKNLFDGFFTLKFECII